MSKQASKKGSKRKMVSKGNTFGKPQQTSAADGTVMDDRFRTIQTDPKFARLSRDRTAVEVDDRFKSVLSDGRFEDGRELGFKAASDSGINSVTADVEGSEAVAGTGVASNDMGWRDELLHVLEGTGQIPLQRRLELLGQLSRGDVELDSEDEDEDEDEAEVVRALMAEDGLSAAARAIKDLAPSIGDEDEDVEEGDETNRLAFVNLDWAKVKARDVLAVARSFAPPGGRVLRATIYVSDFGQKQLEQERLHGPALLLRAGSSSIGVGGGGGGLQDGDSAAGPNEVGDESEEDEDEDEPDLSAVRQYELSKLKYFFAIAECDSPTTGLAVQQECDGRELEASGNVMDVRFVPDDQEFGSRPISDTATEIEGTGGRYRAPRFSTQALQATRVEISWDGEDEERTRLLQMRSGGAASAAQVDDRDLQQYLGSESDSNSSSSDVVSSDDDDRVNGGKLGSTATNRKRMKGKALRSKLKMALLGKTGDASDDASNESAEQMSADEDDFLDARTRPSIENANDGATGFLFNVKSDAVEHGATKDEESRPERALHRKETSGYKRFKARRKEIRAQRKSEKLGKTPSNARSTVDDRFRDLLGRGDFAVDPTDSRYKR